VILSTLLVVAIAAVLLLPTGRKTRGQESPTIFALVESDYISPLISSAVAIRRLNGLTKQVAQFAGYDQVCARAELQGTVSLVSVTRFSGDLLTMFNVGFLTRSNYSNEAFVYISERLWDTAFSRSSNVLNMTIRLHETAYRIAGVTRDFHGLLEGTEIWMPIRSRSALGGLNSMRIVGTLRRGCDWKAAQAELSKLFKRSMAEQVYAEGKGVKMLPVINAIVFEEGMVTVAKSEERKSDVQFAADYQPAALPSRRGS
jgi:hypothetical protein